MIAIFPTIPITPTIRQGGFQNVTPLPHEGAPDSVCLSPSATQPALCGGHEVGEQVAGGVGQLVGGVLARAGELLDKGPRQVHIPAVGIIPAVTITAGDRCSGAS